MSFCARALEAVLWQPFAGQRTWDRWRWLFVLKGGLFVAVTIYLILHYDDPSLFVLFVLLIPALFAAFLLGAALTATDGQLRKMINYLSGLNV
jgi:hypothetical protein